MSFKPARLYLPGVFLLLVGIGNMIVGTYKAQQYRQVVDALSTIEASASLENASPLRRMQIARLSADRQYQRRKTASSRLSFYYLVSFGGKLFAGLSLPFLIVGIYLHLRERRSEHALAASQPATPE